MSIGTDKIRVAVVEDHAAYRLSLAQIFEGTPGFVCVGDYADAESALTGLRGAPADVVLLDLELAGMGGETMLRRLPRRPGYGSRTLVLTIHDEPERIFRALTNGASGYLVKPVSPARLVDAVAELHAGGSPMSPSVARLVVAWVQEQGRRREEVECLSRREAEVLELLAAGLSNVRIAERLGIGVRTVGTHVQHIYDKLEVRTRAEAARRAGVMAPVPNSRG